MDPYLLVILAFLSLLVLYGYWRSRSAGTDEDFMVASRTLSAPVLIGTLLATWIGSGTIIGAAGLAYEKGFSALWFDAGVWLALIVLFFVAGRARRFGQYTVPDILEARYNSVARVLGAVVIIIAYTAVVSYQFRAGGLVLHVVTGIDQDTGILITAAFVIIYTALAGMISVAYTDVVNGVVMLVGLAVALPFMLTNAGGWNEVVARLPETHFQLLGTLSLKEALSYALPTMLLLLGESCMYQRFFSAKSARAARIAVVGWLIGTIVVEGLVVVMAIVGSSLFPQIDKEMVILHSVKNALPLVMGTVLLAAIVAIIVSTADSFLLSPATSFMRDIYQRFLDPEIEGKRFLLYSRLTVIILGIVAFAQVEFFPDVLEHAIYAYTMYGVGITPAVLAAFFWKRATTAGGISSISSGMLVTILWQLFGDQDWLPTVYPALIISLGCLVVVSLFTSTPDSSKWQPFFEESKQKN